MEVFSSFYDKDNNQVREVMADIIDENSYNKELENKVLFFGDGSNKCKDVLTSGNAYFTDNFSPSATYMGILSLNKYNNKDFEDVAYFEPMVTNYRESYDMFACSGILFNHESPLRGIEFVTRKISDAVARISEGIQDVIELGNLDASRDWGYAPEFVEGMYKMLQHNNPDTFVLATNKAYTVRQFVQYAFSRIRPNLLFVGKKRSVSRCRYNG